MGRPLCSRELPASARHFRGKPAVRTEPRRRAFAVIGTTKDRRLDAQERFGTETLGLDHDGGR
jgi:hypothetical protein